MLVRCGDDFVVADRAAGLDDASDAGLGQRVQPVAEREERIRRSNCAAGSVTGFRHCKASRIKARLLPTTNADSAAVGCDNDRVGRHVGTHTPSQFEIAPHHVVGLYLADHIPVGPGVTKRICTVDRLHQHTAINAAVMANRLGRWLCFQDAHRLANRQQFAGFSRIPRSNHHLGKHSADQLCQRRSDRPVDRDDATERRNRIARVSLSICRLDIAGNSRSARIRVLDDNRRRFIFAKVVH